MHDLVVVGGGFWGSAVAWHARRAGLEVTLLDDGRPTGASRNAAGMVHPDSFAGDVVQKILPPWWAPVELNYGMEWLTEHAGLTRTSYLFSSYLRPDRQTKRHGLYCVPHVDRVLELGGEPVDATVAAIKRAGNGWVVHGVRSVCTPFEIPTKRVVIAAGCGTDGLLYASRLSMVGVKALRGRAVVAKVPRQPELPVTYMARPYVSHTLRAWGDCHVRCGDTVERTPGADSEPLEPLKQIVLRHYPDTRHFEVKDGLRPMCDQVTAKLAAPGLVVATGGNRVGLVLAAPVARHTLKLLEVA